MNKRILGTVPGTWYGSRYLVLDGDEKMGCDYYTPEKTSAMDFQDRQMPMASVYHFLKSNLTSYVRLLRVKIHISFKL